MASGIGGFSGASNTSSVVSTGPILVWARFVDSYSSNPFAAPSFYGNIYYVGTCERYPVNELENAYISYYSSIGGSEKPTDKIYAGSSEIIVLDLNRFNTAVVNMLIAAPRYGRTISSLQYRNQVQPNTVSAGTVPIVNSRLDRGSLLMRNKGFYQIWLQYTNWGKQSSDPFPSLPPGDFYYCCSTAGAYIPRQGTTYQMRRIIVEAMELQDDRGFNWGLKTNTPDVFAALMGLTPG
jgi:hypothetical protein